MSQDCISVVVTGENSSRQVERRNVLKNAATGIFAGAGISGSGTVGASTGDNEVEIRRETTTVDSEKIEALVETSIASRLLSVAENPDYDSTAARRIDVYIQDKYFAHLFEVKTALGSLKLGYESSQLRYGELDLERSGLSKKTRKTISKHIDWPADTDGKLTIRENQESVTFTRDVSDEEREELSALVDGKQIVTTVAYQRTGTNDAHYVALTEEHRYTIKRTLNKIESRESPSDSSNGSKIGIQASCQAKASYCYFDIMLAFPHCAAGSVACTITGPMTAACVVAVLAFCAPNVPSSASQAIVHTLPITVCSQPSFLTS